MKLSREIKTAILVISAILLFIWGYSFLKGKDLLTSDKNVFVVYDNILGLAPSAPVTLNGYRIGKVNKIKINPDGKLLVELQIHNDFPISKSSVAEIYDSGLVGGKEIAIIPNLEDKSVIADGDFLKPSRKLGLTENIAEKLEPLEKKIQLLLDNANVMLVNINQVLDASTQANIKNSFAELNKTLIEFSQLSKSANQMIAENKTKLNSTITNFDKTSANFAAMSDSLAKANLGQTVKNLEKTLASVDKIMADMEAGKGTMGKLMKDDKMYNNFTDASKELELLLQDLRLHPTRYINVSVFGKKEKPYVAPKEVDSSQE
ncbi:MlaD family protein [uncultured Flavobacterium sp.]|uniref:MlaD family protein n=1 Tax=uncultured Flavobacterium sp. TaxID=165435 RepID=UPI0030C87FFE